MLNFTLVQINPVVLAQWDETVLNNPFPKFFHLSCWIKTLVETYKFQPLCFIIQSGNNCTIPLIIVKTLAGKKKAVSLPFSDECDIHTEINPNDIVSKLRSIVKDQNIDRLEFRGTSQFNPSGRPSHTYFGHRLQLTTDTTLLWNNLSSSKQRNVNKAQRENVSVTFHNDHNSVSKFYQLHCITRKRHGLPPQPIRFFDAIYENIIAKGAGEIALAESKNVIIAGAIFLFCRFDVLFKYGASDKNFQLTRANDLVMWEGIIRYSKKGMKTFSFGKTEKSHEGLCRFKEDFGASRFFLYDHIYDVSSGKKLIYSPRLQGFHNKIFGLMPVQMLRLCGEMLYKYFA